MVAEAARSDGSRIPVGMLFVPCRHGISHAREEYTDPEQLSKGTDVLREAIRALSRGR